MPEGAGTQPPADVQQTTQTAERDGLGARVRRGMTKFRWFGVLLVVGAGLMALAFFVVYPKPEVPIAVPASPSLVIYTNEHLSQITYLVTTDHAGLPEMEITVSLGSKLVGSQVKPLPVPHPVTSSLEVTLPLGLTFRDCSGCTHYAGEAAWVKPLSFDSGKATDVFPIKTANFGVDVSDVYAYAAIPEISLMSLTPQQNQVSGVRVLPPALRAEYRIPGAGNYDWSSGPAVPTIAGSTATWQEILATSDVPGQTAAGVNHRRQAHDTNFTFFAGFLLGLAGSVVLAGVQLVLPSAAGSDAKP